MFEYLSHMLSNFRMLWITKSADRNSIKVAQVCVCLNNLRRSAACPDFFILNFIIFLFFLHGPHSMRAMSKRRSTSNVSKIAVLVSLRSKSTLKNFQEFYGPRILQAVGVFQDMDRKANEFLTIKEE